MMRNYAGYRRCLALLLAFALLLPAGTPAAAGGAQGSGGPVPVEVADATPTPAADAQALEIVPVPVPSDGDAGASSVPSGDGAAMATPYNNNGDETGGATPAPGDNGATPAPGGNGATPAPPDGETIATPVPSGDGAATPTPYNNNGDETGSATPAPGGDKATTVPSDGGNNATPDPSDSGNNATSAPSDSENSATPDPSDSGNNASPTPGEHSAAPVPADALQTPLPEGGTGASLAEALSALPEGLVPTGTAAVADAALVFLDFGDRDGLRPAPGARLNPVLYVSIDGGAHLRLTQELLARFGLSGAPTAALRAGAEPYAFSLALETALPAALTAADGTAHALSWRMEPPALEGYTLFAAESAAPKAARRAAPAAAAAAGGYAYALGAPASLLAARSAEHITITSSKEVSFQQSIHWVDNYDEAGARPAPEEYAQSLRVYYTLDGGQEVLLTPESWAALGFDPDGCPQPAVTADGLGVWELAFAADLPHEYTVTDAFGNRTAHTLTWRTAHELPVEGPYEPVTVTDGNAASYPSAQGNGVYYVLLTDLSFRVNTRRGTQAIDEGVRELLDTSLTLHVETDREKREYLLGSLITREVTYIEDTDTADGICNDVLQISPTWKYNLDGSLIEYRLSAAAGSLPLDGVAGAAQGDSLTIDYRNDGVPNHAGKTDAAYPGGSVNLTLTGTRGYEAQKVWLDDGSAEAAAQRPEGTLQLWRYREGQEPGTATPVFSGGRMVEAALPGDGGAILFEENGKAIELPKYDADGFRYIYCVREYMSEGEGLSDYEQVFGAVAEQADGTAAVTDTLPAGYGAPARKEGDTFLYHGGTLSNRITDTVRVAATKVWDAAAFQSEFEDVRVELTLQSRPAGAGEDAWTDVPGADGTPVTVVLDDFYAENMTITTAAEYSRYDALGRPLEYRYVETGVYQGDGGENLLQADGSFTLQQAGMAGAARPVRYESAAVYSNGDGQTTTITNTIADRLDYHVIKLWHDEAGQPAEPPAGASITAALYRDGDLTAPYAAGALDGVADAQATQFTTADGFTVTFRETEPWVAVFSGLPEYSDNGRLYEYALLEQAGTAGYFPWYETAWDEQTGDYTTRIINAPGEGHRIQVQKRWIDGSDTTHRLPVTIAVYSKVDRTVTVGGTEYTYYKDQKLGEAVLRDNVWSALVSIGHLDPATDVYIRELKVGETDVYAAAGAPTADDPYPAPHQFATQYHTYDVTYAAPQQVANDYIYTATNRRLGNVNLTVTKTWLDGGGAWRERLAAALDGAGLTLALQLDFANGAKDGFAIDYAAGTVTVGADALPVMDQSGAAKSGALQTLDLTQQQKDYHFFTLPKYDLAGAVVRYTVREVLVDAAGNILPLANAPDDAAAELLAEYAVAYGEPVYRPFYDGAGSALDIDTHDASIVNRLQDEKTVSWDKVWKDAYADGNGKRPDIYLDIYRTVHTDRQIDPEAELYRSNYQVYTSDEGWTASLSVPQYDPEGYEYFYYAVERTLALSEDFDYAPAEYSLHGTAIGAMYDGEGAAGAPGGPASKLEVNGSGVWALVEGGTFTNRLVGTVAIQGQKLWANLPASYPADDLPAATFVLMQKVQGAPDDTAIEAARVTIEQWADVMVNGSYIFRLEYEGGNVNAVENGAMSVQPETAGAPRLPKYDDDGNLYEYSALELVDFKGEAPHVGDVFNEPVAFNTYLIVNGYHGAAEDTVLAVKKLLVLPAGADGSASAYPAVTLELTRSYTSYASGPAGTPVQDAAFSKRLSWSASQVKADYEAALAAGAGPADPLAHTFVFEDLPRYAPNGSAYAYTVTEVRDELGGFETWAAAGDLNWGTIVDPTNAGASVSGLAPEAAAGGQAPRVQATLANRRQQTPPTIELTGRKIWQDYDDAFGYRPDELVLSVSRRANSQSGMDNAIAPQRLTAGQDYDIRYDTTGEENAWTYTITGPHGEGLEQYAPNGMPWIYIIEETTVPEPYAVTPAGGRVERSANLQSGDTLTLPNLTNSIETRAAFRKQWRYVDENGAEQTIRYDPLGLRMRVTFALQVQEAGGAWQDAAAYFAGALNAAQYAALFDGYHFESTLGGADGFAANDRRWDQAGYFEGLPTHIVTVGRTAALAYRVVESIVYYGSAAFHMTVDDAGDYTVHNGAAGTPFAAVRLEVQDGVFVTVNVLESTGLIVEKRWEDDHDDAYGTRPGDGAGGWRVDVAVQMSTQEGVWELVSYHGSDGSLQPLVLTLTGTAGDGSARARVDGMPVMNTEGKRCSYRVRELVPGWDEDGVIGGDELVEPGGRFHEAYEVSYASQGTLHTVTNDMEPRVDRYAMKRYSPGTAEAEKTPVTLVLEYLAENGRWTALSTVVLVGEADADAVPSGEAEAWLAAWTDLPERMPGSDLTGGDGKTLYRVREEADDGFVLVGEAQGTHGQGGWPLVTFTNMPVTGLTVEKTWYTDAPLGQRRAVFTLYRSTIPGDYAADGARIVRDDAGAPVTVTLTGNDRYTFEDLPRYDEQGRALYYYALESGPAGYETGLTHGGSAAEGFWSRAVNIQLVEVAGVKTWDDADDQDGKRPGSVTIRLYAGGREIDSRTVTPDPDDGTWRYAFTGLPGYEPDGTKIVYTVTEDQVPGYATAYDGYDVENRCTPEQTSVTVQKIWDDLDDRNGLRPEEITVRLLANGAPTGRTLTLSAAQGWVGAFTELPVYEAGVKIAYTVEEAPGADSPYVLSGTAGGAAQGFRLTNRLPVGGLTVEKAVTGLDGSGRAFTFTVVLTGTAAPVNGAYGDMTFVDNVATFTLRHGEKASASGLPAGAGYAVTEAEANADGYTTTAAGAAGTIPDNAVATASFENAREQEDPLPIPPTGDGTHLGLFLAAAGVTGASTAVLGALLLRRRRRARR